MTKIMSKYKNHDVCGGIKMAKSSKNSSVSLHQQYQIIIAMFEIILKTIVIKQGYLYDLVTTMQ